MGSSARPSGSIDMGCGVRVPLRSSALAVVSSYRYGRDRATPLLEKRNRAHAINATIDGSWRFQNGRAREEITPGMVIVADKHDAYACAHSHVYPNSSLVVNLCDGALDADAVPVFGRRILSMPPVLALIRRACAAQDDEQFDSRVFEIFDFVSKASRPAREERDRHLLRVQRIKRFIEDHARERIVLGDIADALALSPFTCLRIFKHATGFTPSAYLTQCRIEEAKRLLGGSRAEIGEIAKRCGFGGQAHFARFFKSAMGIAPSEFRRQALR